MSIERIQERRRRLEVRQRADRCAADLGVIRRATAIAIRRSLIDQRHQGQPKIGHPLLCFDLRRRELQALTTQGDPMDKERLQLAKTLSDQIGRLEDALRSARMDVPGLGRSLPSHPVITALTPAALARVRAVMEEDLQEQLEKANKAFEAL